MDGLECRIWEGTTERGVPMHCYIPRLAVSEDLPPEMHQQFMEELIECRKPSVAIEAIPLRMLI